MNTYGIGRFCQDPELTPVNDTFKASFTLAIDEWRKVKGERKKETQFLDFEVWDKAAELICQYLKKGQRIFIKSASPRKDTWEDKEGNKRSKTYFRINDFEFVESANKSSAPPKEPETVKQPEDDSIPY